MSEPDLRTLAVLLKLYRLSADQLLELNGGPGSRAPSEEERLVSLYRQLPQDQRKELLLLETLIRHWKQPEKT